MSRRTRNIDLALAGDLALELAFVRARARTLDRTLDLDRNSDFDHAVALAHDLADTLAYDTDIVHAHALAAALATAIDRSCTHAHTFDRNLAVALTNARNRADALAHSFERSLRFATTLERATSDANSAPGRVPQCLVALAVQVLPVHTRPRYRAEFGVELVELPRQERLRYALRVLIRAWGLRRALADTLDGAPARPPGW